MDAAETLLMLSSFHFTRIWEPSDGDVTLKAERRVKSKVVASRRIVTPVPCDRSSFAAVTRPPGDVREGRQRGLVV